MKKRLFAILLSVVMVLSLVPAAFAAEGTVTNAKTNNNITAVKVSTGSTAGEVTMVVELASTKTSGNISIVVVSKKATDEDLAVDADTEWGDLPSENGSKGYYKVVNAESITSSAAKTYTVNVPSAGDHGYAGSAQDITVYVRTDTETSFGEYKFTLPEGGKFATAQCAITWDLNYTGATAATPEDQEQGENVTLPSAPTRTGYTFNGWFDAASSGTQVTATSKVPTSASVTYYAYWTANELSLANITVPTLTEGKEMTEVTLPAASNGTGSYTYSYTGTLPAGLSIDVNTRKLSGTPTATTDENGVKIIWKAVDNDSTEEVTKEFTIKVVDAATPVITVTNNEHTYDGTAKTATVTATLEGEEIAAGDISVKYAGEDSQTNANESGYAIVVTIDGKTYDPTETLIINKKALTLTFAGNDAGNTLDDVTYTLVGVEDEDTVEAAVVWTEVTGTKDACDSEDCNDECTCRGETPEACITEGHDCQFGAAKTAKDFPLEAGSTHAYTATLSGTDAGNYTLANGEMSIAANNPPYIPPAPVAKGEHKAYMIGRSATEFVPEGEMTRAEAATILARLTEGFDENGIYPAAPFSDLEAGAWYGKYINFAAYKGIVNGYEDGTFKPEQPITRAELAKMIAGYVKVAKIDDPATVSDVAGHWAEGYIAALEKAQIVGGYPDGTFRPDQAITRAEAATMVNGAIGRVPMAALDLSLNDYVNPFMDVYGSQWFYANVMEATIDHVIDDFHK